MITYPLNNIDYTAEDAELYFSTRESGVYDGGDFEVTNSGIDNDVTVGTGIAWIHNTKFSGKVVALKEPKTLTLSLPNSVYDRIDAIVIQFDANDNATNIIVKEGIASSTPVAPAVVRTESLYELHIFHVQRKAGATVISVDNLVDLRNNSNYCGIMFDPISSIDTTLTKRGFAADAAATGNQIKRATNVRNLLDNSDFKHFVALAGIGGNHGTQAYAGCRWILDSGTVTGEANAKNDGYKNITLNGTIRQIVANPPTIGTVAIEMVSGAASAIYKDGAVTITSNGGVIKNVRLFEGEYTEETLPHYVPKGYGAELAECQWYFERIGNSASEYLTNGVITTGDSHARLSLIYRRKRIIPTIIVNSSQFRLLLYGGGIQGHDLVTSITAYGVDYDRAMLMVSFNGTSSKIWQACLQRIEGCTSAWIDVCADL